MSKIAQRLINPLNNPKVRVALATVIAAFLAEWGFDVSETGLATIIGAGVTVIAGIVLKDRRGRRATNDPGRKARMSDAEQK